MRWNLWAIEPNAACEIDPEMLGEVEGGGGDAPYTVEDGVATLRLDGVMLKRPSHYGDGTARLARNIGLAAADPAVRGILLVVDSPGGTVDGTAALADAVREAGRQKPVHAYIDGIGASAAYWVASQAHSITTGRTALVGSIGTYAVIPDYSKMAEKFGITVHVVRSTPLKGAGVDGAPVTKEHLASFQRMVDALNGHFLAAVADGRGVSAARVDEWATGEVFTGDTAQRMGLVDRLGGMAEARAALIETTGRTTVYGQEEEKPMALRDIWPFGLAEAIHSRDAAPDEAETEELDAESAVTAADLALPDGDDDAAALRRENERLAAEVARLSGVIDGFTSEAREAAKAAAVRAFGAEGWRVHEAAIDAADLAGARALSAAYDAVARATFAEAAGRATRPMALPDAPSNLDVSAADGGVRDDKWLETMLGRTELGKAALNRRRGG